MPKWVADAKIKKKKQEQKTTPKKSTTRLSDAQYQKMYGQPRKKTTPAKKVESVSKRSTFLGGGSAVRKVEENRRTSNTRTVSTERQSSSSTRRTTMTDAQYQKTYGRPRNSTVKRPSVFETASKRAEAARQQKITGGIDNSEKARQEREARRLAAQRQKSGLNDQPTAAQKAAADRAIKNTPGLIKKAGLDAASGYGQTLTDVIARTASSERGTEAKAMKMGIEKGTKQYQELEEERKRTAEEARKDNQSLYQKMQQRQAEWDEKTKDAKGFEKAYYGAVESGTGMVADTAIGLLTGTGQVGALASMGLRTYGSSANQAKSEGATDAEAGWYGLGQAVKEMGTEMIGGGGLAKAAYGKGALSLGDIATNTLIRNLKGQTADLAHMGIRLFSDVAEENIEELAGWALDPWVKELTYGRNVRDREGQSAKSAMRERSDALKAEIQSEDDARAAAAYISSDDFVEQTKQQYIAAGMKEKEAEETAERMRDYLTASLTGDTDSMEKIEDDVYKKVAGSHSVWSDYSFRELKETFEATTLLVGATGLPGNLTTMNRGNLVKDQLGEEGVRALANTAIDFEDAQMSTKAKAMKARMDEGKELTGTQVYELQAGMQEQVRRDTEREQSSRSLAARTIESDNLLTPYRQNENGGLDLDEVTENTYRENANRAGAAIDALTKESKESITDTQKVDGSKAIAGFQTGVFTVDDANALNYSNTTVRAAFEAVTGVNLGQYIVRKKNGEVDIPATNTKTKDALFAMAADNLVKSAQAETANWMDNAKGQVVTQVSARMGARGSEVLQMALDGVDERDRSKYMMTANATDMLYQAARNMGTEWESVSTEATRMFPGISESKLKAMYEAGLEDRDMANDKARGRQIRMGEALSEMGEQETATGKVYIDSEVPPKGSVIRTFTEIAKNLGADIHFVDYIYDANNDPIEGANGSYDPNTNTFYLNVSTGAETNIGYIFMHETTHYLKRFAPEQYQALENLVRERWFAFNPSQMQDAIARKIEAYKRVTKGQQVLTEEQALEEIIADASHDFINDPEFAKQVAEEDMGLAKAVLDSIRNALRMLRRIFASGSVDDDTHMNSLFRELDILTEAERLWLDAYKVAVRNSSLAAVNTWQENANEQSSLSVSDGYTIQDGNARWTEERIDDLIERYGASNPDYSQAYAVLMNPRDFLHITIEDELLRKWRESAASQPEGLTYKEGQRAVWDKSYLEGRLLDDQNFPLDEAELRGQAQTPFLYIRSNKSGQRVLGHEGRHRMRALMEAGVTSVPVVIEDPDTKTSKQNVDNMILGYQEDVYNGAGIVEVNDLVPIKESNRDELIQKFGGEAQVRFSISAEDYSAAVESGEISAGFGEESTRYSVREEDPPQNTIKAYKVFVAFKNRPGELYPPMVASPGGMPTPVGRWINADTGELARNKDGSLVTTKKGRVKVQEGGKGTNKGKGGSLAWRPGWHLGSYPDAKQFAVKDPETGEARTAFPPNFVWAECEIAADNDYQIEALSYGVTEKGKFDRTQAGLPYIPKDGYYKYRTNADPNTVPWLITGAMKVNRILDDEEAREICAKFGATPMKRAGGDINLAEYGFEKGDVTPTSDEDLAKLPPAVDYSDEIRDLPGYVQRDINFDDPQIQKELAMNGQDADYYKALYNEQGRNGAAHDAKYSIAADLDEPYMQAVNSGNMEEAQKLVDEAARAAGMRVAHRYHGTLNAGFTVFSKAKANVGGDSGAGFYFSTNEDDSEQHYSEEEGADNKAKIDSFADYLMEFEGEWNGVEIDSDETAHRVATEEIAKNPGVYDVYLNYSRPYIRDHRNSDYLNDVPERDYSTNIYDDILDDFDESLVDPEDFDSEDDYEEARYIAMDEHFYEAIDDAVRSAYNSLEENYEVIDVPDMSDLVSAITTKAVEGSLTWDDIRSTIYNTGEVYLQREGWYESEWGESELTRAIIEGFGYDAIEDKEVGSKFGQLSRDMQTGTEHIIVFRPEQIKLADTVTYAEDGSVIPLSERFNPSNNDIRYSLPTQDSDGNILTDGQMEYFKNSQARDRNGRLAVVYHSTRNGGFTIFDPAYSDDKRSVFFTDSYGMSRTYSGGGADFNAMTFGLPEPGELSTLEDVLQYFDGLSQEQENKFGIYLYDDADNTYEYRPQSWSNSLPLSNYIDEYGTLPEDGVRGEFFDGETGEIVGEFNTLEEMLTELKESVAYINENVGGTRNNGEIGTYACYLDLQNPLIIDCKGANWDSIQEEGFDTLFLSYDGESFYVDGTTIPWTLDEIRSQYGDGFADRAEEWIETADETDMEIGDTLYTWYGAAFDPEEEGYPREGNTRYWCEEAWCMDCDGVIFRNLYDNGQFSERQGYEGDVYVAFSSEQIKDINNENPTENPDIRYSFSEEDDLYSYMASVAAESMSNEELEYYESIAETEEKHNDYLGKMRKWSEDKISEFYESLISTDEMPSEDERTEEGRIRMSKAREDFFNSLDAKWNDKWLSNGEVLDIKSVKPRIKQLIMAQMRGANATRQYKTEVLNRTLFDVRTAYMMAKRGRIEVADEIIWNSARNMIANLEFIEERDDYETFKEIRDYIKANRIQINEGDFASHDHYKEFLKKNFGKMTLVKDGTGVDQVWQVLNEKYGSIFPEEVASPANQLAWIAEYLDSYEPIKWAYTSEQAADLAIDIADELGDIVFGYGKPIESLADHYKNKYDEKAKALKARCVEAERELRKTRRENESNEAKIARLEERNQRTEKKLAEEKQKGKDKEAKRKSVRERAKYTGRIQKNYDWLTKRLLQPTKDKNIPEGFRKDLARLLCMFDLQTERSKALEEKYGIPSQKTFKMWDLHSKLCNVMNEDNGGIFQTNAYIEFLSENLAKRIDGKAIDTLETPDLLAVDEYLKIIVHQFREYDKVRVGEKRVQLEDLGGKVIQESDDRVEKRGQSKEYGGLIKMIDSVVNFAELTPIHFFQRMGTMYTMYKEVRKSFDKYIRNEKYLLNRIQNICSEFYTDKKNRPGSELQEWRDSRSAQELKLQNGTVTMTVAQMMSLYCMSKRNQALLHMTKDGIVVTPITEGAWIEKQKANMKGRKEQINSIQLTLADIDLIKTKLTPDQMKIADKLQDLMSGEMAEWGNEMSMKLYGIRMFKEKDYFPIKVSSRVTEKNLDDIDITETIKNFGFTKPTQPNARNAIEVDDIFKVVADHCNNMNLYNAYGESISDFWRVFNFKQYNEDGKPTRTVQQALEEAYGKKAIKYIKNFVKDINGNVAGKRTGGLEEALNTALGRAKKAAVFGNIRVALQQPTAIVRAFAVLNPKYLGSIRISKGAMEEMFEHCPIAQWKAWGFYDTYMGRDIEDVMMNKWSRMDTALSGIYGQLDNITWTAIWQMCKAEVKDTHPDVKEGTQEFWDLCNERASYVFDTTQVVDSPFHRSDAMRSKDIMVKSLTSFQSEPTLTFNVVRSGFADAADALRDGNKGKAAMAFGRTLMTFISQAVVVSATAAVWDAVRRKNPDGGDDDDDKKWTEFWTANFFNNLKDNINLFNNIYLAREAMPYIDKAFFGGYGASNNLLFQSFDTITTGITQFKKKMEKGDAYDKTWYDIYTNLIGGVGYMFGIPFKTLMKDFKGITSWLGWDVLAADSIETDVDPKSLTESKWFDYDRNPLKIKDGSAVDNIMNHFGLNLTEREKEQIAAEEAAKERAAKVDDIIGKTADLSGEAKDKKVWSYVTTYMKAQNGDKPLADVIQEGDYRSVQEYREMYEAAGGNADYFDERVFATSKSAMKKTIIYDPTDEQIEAQDNIKNYLLEHGMTETELSDMVYKSDTAKDMKVAFRINDKDAMLETLEPLVRAGLSYEDLERLWENRNRMQITSYKGRYKDRLKSTGKFIWPTDGQITSYFGYRNAPTAGASSNHPAIDIGAPMGADVVAADGGVVIYAGTNGGYGNSVGIKHDNGMVTYYNHLSAWNVNVGDTVAQGQQIANVGSTGISTGPHLDFKILDADGEPVDPLKYLASRS